MSTTAAKSYEQLMEEFPIRPIRSEAEHEACAERLYAMMSDQDCSEDHAAYMELLAMVIEQYEKPVFNKAVNQINDPVTYLQGLMRESSLSKAELGYLLNSRSRVYEILNGTRKISKSQALLLSEYFDVPAQRFMHVPVIKKGPQKAARVVKKATGNSARRKK